MMHVKILSKTVLSIPFIALAALVTTAAGGTPDIVWEQYGHPDGTRITSFHHGAYISDVAWHPDGLRVASSGSNNEVRLWNVASEKLERTFGPHDNDVRAIAFSPDGTLLAAGEGGWDDYPAGSSIRIWRVSDGELLHTLEGHGVWVYDLSFSPDGQTIISAGRDSNTPLRISIRLWRVTGGSPFEEYDEGVTGGIPSITFDPEGGAFAYARGDGNVVVARHEAAPAGVDDIGSTARLAFLKPPVPNPLLDTASIRFGMRWDGPVTLSVHDMAGRRVASLAAGRFTAGEHEVKWDGHTRHRYPVSQGIYFIRLAAHGGTEAQRLVVSR